MMRRRSDRRLNERMGRGDMLVALALLTVSVLYLTSLPHNLGGSDEAYFLVESKRVADGEVMYRDVFEFIPPGAAYIMAAAFRIFGASMTTARGVMTILHALTAVLLYAICRQLCVARALAALVPLAYLGLCQSAWPFASWHWFSSFLLVAQCWVLCRTEWPTSALGAFIPGIVSGASIGVQHQRGLPVAAGVGVLLLLMHLSARRDRPGARWSSLAWQLTVYAAGILLVIVPLMAPSLWLAGIDVLIEGLVRFPVEAYRPTFRTAWGAVGPLTKDFAPYTWPNVLRFTPAVLALMALRLVIGLITASDRRMTRWLSVLFILSISAAASVWYYADFIHVAFIAPIFFVGMAETLRWVFSPLRRWPHVETGMASIVALGCAVALSLHLERNHSRAWQTYRVPHDTAFGRIDFATKWEPVLIDATRAALLETPGAELFCYPTLAGPYLTTGGKNPTRYQFLDARAQPRRYIEAVVDVLRQRRVEFLLIAYAYIRPDDPIAQLMRSDYEAVPIPALPLTGEFPTTLLYRRKANAAPS